MAAIVPAASSAFTVSSASALSVSVVTTFAAFAVMAAPFPLSVVTAPSVPVMATASVMTAFPASFPWKKFSVKPFQQFLVGGVAH